MKQMRIKQIVRKISLIGLIFNFHITCRCQIVDSDSILLKIKYEVTSFFIKQGVLSKSVIEDSSNFTFAYEILEEKIIGYNKNGIYRIGVQQSHSDQHILIKEGNRFKIYELKEIDFLIKDLLEYTLKNSFEDGRTIKYIYRIMDLYWYQYKKQVNLKLESQ